MHHLRRNEGTLIGKLPHEHDYGPEWKSDEQKHWKECSCGGKVAESPHSFAWVIDRKATQEMEGLKHEECTACGMRRNEGTVIEKLPPDHEHSFGEAWKSDAQSHWKECSCGERSEEGAHSFAWITDREPTQEAVGLQHEECDLCGLKRNEGTIIEKLPSDHEHSFGTAWSMDAQSHWKECSCGERSEESPHSFAWVIDREPTQETAGLRHEECELCGLKRSEDTAIEKLPAPTPSPTPAPTPSPTPEPTPAPDRPIADAPFIKGDLKKMGWDIIIAILNQTEEGATITVDMNGTSLVPGNVLDDMKARNVTVVFDMGGGIAWSVGGQSVIPGKTDAIDFSVKVGTGSIPADIVSSIANGCYHIQLSLAHEGAFECTPVLSVNLGKENAGLTASLYYYNQASGKLEPVSEAGITEDGTANLAFRHASDYLIVVKSADGTADTPPQTPVDPAPTPTPPGGTDISLPQTPPGITDTAPPQAPTDSVDSSSPAPEAAQGTDSGAPESSVPLSPGTGEDTQSSWFNMAIGALALILSVGIAAEWRRKASEHDH